MSLYERILSEGSDTFQSQMQKLAKEIGHVKGEEVHTDMMASSYNVMFPSKEQAEEFIARAGKKIEASKPYRTGGKFRVQFWPHGKKKAMLKRVTDYEASHKARFGRYSSPWS